VLDTSIATFAIDVSSTFMKVASATAMVARTSLPPSSGGGGEGGDGGAEADVGAALGWLNGLSGSGCCGCRGRTADSRRAQWAGRRVRRMLAKAYLYSDFGVAVDAGPAPQTNLPAYARGWGHRGRTG
jgi:hypothetical protein